MTGYFVGFYHSILEILVASQSADFLQGYHRAKAVKEPAASVRLSEIHCHRLNVRIFLVASYSVDFAWIYNYEGSEGTWNCLHLVVAWELSGILLGR